MLTEAVGDGRREPTLRFWEWSAPAVVIGSFQSVRNEVDLEQAQRHGIEVVRRISGGGAMFTEVESVITYSIYAPAELVLDDPMLLRTPIVRDGAEAAGKVSPVRLDWSTCRSCASSTTASGWRSGPAATVASTPSTPRPAR